MVDSAVPAGPQRRAALNRLLFPGPAEDLQTTVATHGDLSVLSTRQFLYGLEPDEEIEVHLERGVRLLIQLDAVTDADAKGQRSVLVRLNGQIRAIDTRDRSIEAEEVALERADLHQPGHVAAPLTGIVTLAVKAGDPVKAGGTVATIEAMKMESAISAPIEGTIERVVVHSGARVEPGDLLVVIA